MSRTGLILLVDDDHDECELITSALKRNGVDPDIVCFNNGEDVLEYLKSETQPILFILADVNMPGRGGLALKEAINADEMLRERHIPFICMTNAASPTILAKAYELNVQGFFEKSKSYDGLKDLLKKITSYWQLARTPQP